MKVLFVFALALVQGLASNIQISNLPVGIEISNLPSQIEISNLPSQIEISNLPSQGGIEISNLPIEHVEEIEISHLPSAIEVSLLPSAPEISNLPIDLPSGIDISNLPVEVEDGTPSCVKYVRALLSEVLRALPGNEVESPIAPQVPVPVPEADACSLCFQKLQLLIETANSRNSVSLTNF